MRFSRLVVAALLASSTAIATESQAPTIELPTTEKPIVRVGGDREVQATWDADDAAWRSGSSTIDTPLPEGYPAPTPPGAIELKIYPAVRRAEITENGANNDGGFWPLFNHIKRRDIAMTSPVEMDYASDREWTMSFLYRRAEQGPVGSDAKDPRVVVRDAEPLMVVSLGGRGSYDRSRIDADLQTLREWLKENPQLVEAGSPRALMYNGPSILWGRKWLEVQLPVKPAEPAPAE